MTARQRKAQRARRALLTGTAIFFGVQWVLAVMVERQQELRDPKFGYRMQRFHERLAENPDRPLVVVLGSSRVEAGFRPAILPNQWRVDGEPALVFNFGLPFQGVPAVAELGLDRILREGIRPQHLFVEILVATLKQDAPTDKLIKAEQYNLNDLAVFRRYASEPTRMYRRWLASRITPAWGHRLCLVSRYAPSLLPLETRQDWYYHELDELGWRWGGTEVTVEDRARRMQATAREYQSRLQSFEVQEAPDQALRAIAARCRDEGIRLTFFTMPEAAVYRNWYSAEGAARANEYLARLGRECQVNVIDTREWIGDDLQFVDGHHLLESGADQFTRRFQREVIGPALADLSQTTGPMMSRRPDASAK